MVDSAVYRGHYNLKLLGAPARILFSRAQRSWL